MTPMYVIQMTCRYSANALCWPPKVPGYLGRAANPLIRPLTPCQSTEGKYN